MGTSSEVFKAGQSPIDRHFSHGVMSFNTTTISRRGIRVPEYVPSMQPFIANLRLKLITKYL